MLFLYEQHPFIQGEVFAEVQAFEQSSPDDFFLIIAPTDVLIVSSFLQLILTPLGQTGHFFFFIIRRRTSEYCELSAFSLAVIIYMFPYSSEGKLIPVFFANTFAECLEFSPIPLKFMVIVPGLSFLKVKEDIELPIGRRNEAKLWLQVPEHILHCFPHILKWEMLDKFDHRHYLELLLFEYPILLGGIPSVDVDVLVDCPVKLYGLLDVLRVGVLNGRFVTKTALDMAVQSRSTPTSNCICSERLSFCRRRPSEHPRSSTDRMPLASMVRLTSRWRIWFMVMPRQCWMTEWSSLSFFREISISIITDYCAIHNQTPHQTQQYIPIPPFLSSLYMQIRRSRRPHCRTP